MAKIRYKGGNVVTVTNEETGKPEKRDHLEQLLEEVLYIFPEPGSVISVKDGVASWLAAKHPRFLEIVPDKDDKKSKPAPSVLVAVVPRAAAAPEKK